MSTLLDKLTDEILAFLKETSNCIPLPTESFKEESSYSGIGFTFDYSDIKYQRPCGKGVGSIKYTALMIGIDELFNRVYKYTSQKARFIKDKEGNTDVDLYTLSPDEEKLYLQFLKEGAERIWKLLIAYSKNLPFKGYLFDEGVLITEVTEVSSKEWIKGDFVRMNGVIYEAINDIPIGIEISDTDYWSEVSGLYDTKGKVVFFITCGKNGVQSIPNNALVNVLNGVENYLYSFVLWRWYTTAEQTNEANVWASSFDSSISDIRSAIVIRSGPIRRPSSPM